MIAAGEDLAGAWFERLSLEDKVAQLMIPRPVPGLAPREYPDRLGAGGIIVDRHTYSGPRQMAEYVAEAQRAARERNGVPLFVCCDQEGGHNRFTHTGATEVPPSMGVAASGDPSAATDAAALLASELVAMGVNWNFAPVVDVNTNPANPIIGVRAYSDDPLMVSAFATAAIHAYQAAGLLACAKHFPGHGDTALDSHVALPALPHDRARLEAVELPPFRAAIDAGVATIMTAHLRLPALDLERVGTLSAPIVSGLLRGELGFDGMVVTDALEMAAIADEWEEPEAVVEAIVAGCDTLLTGRVPEQNSRVHSALVQAVRSGRISERRFEDALRRVLRAKASYLAAAVDPDPERAAREVGSEPHRQRALELARRSITVVRDQPRALPLPRDLGERLVVLSPSGTPRSHIELSASGPLALGQQIGRFAPGALEVQVEHPLSAAGRAEVARAVRGARVVLVGTLNAVLDPDQIALLEWLRDEVAAGARLVVVALRTPYDLLRAPWLPTYVCAYTSVAPVAAATAEVIFGEQPPRGQLPVDLPGLYRRGHRL
ncbi:MAG: beta-N-acetylhexosaminidase [Chloroflexota bacterium]|nr:beta-N-acetylhexosaminidase [Chloroflexota bacterium]